MKKRFLKLLAFVMALCTLLVTVAFAEEKEVDYGAKLDEALALYYGHSLFSNNAVDYLREALIETFEEDPEFFYELINRIYGRSDRYSKYITPEVYEEQYQQSNSMVGIGIVIEATDDGHLNVSSVSDGPAKAAGIRPGDKLLTVDGESVEGFLPAEVGNLIRGAEGTKVTVEMLRGEEKMKFTVTRAVVRLSDVTATQISDKIGYIELSYFNGISTFIDFMKAYDEFEYLGINTIILDLRNNPGGSLDCFINLMDNIIPEKGVPYAMTWQAKPLAVTTYKSEGYGWEFNKFVILVNENSASAAEVMAGSLQDLGYAVVVGEQTFGKGMGQRHIATSDGDEAILTALEIKLPVSGSYDGIGITPDYKASIKLTPYKLPYLTPLKSKSDASMIKPDNVKPLEERLKVLGYFYGEPDNVWDKRTVYALNAFCKDEGLSKVGSVCNWDLIEKIDAAAKNLEKKFVAHDEAFDLAVEIAEEYAASDKKAKCIDQSLVDFKRDN